MDYFLSEKLNSIIFIANENVAKILNYEYYHCVFNI